MNSKQWVKWFLVLCTATVVAFAGIMYMTDPLLRYGKESGLFSYYQYSELYSNPGIARNYDYDTVMVGTSMIENTDVAQCNELFDCNMVRLPYSGGHCYNMKKILDICFESKQELKAVYWELDEFQLLSDHTVARYPLPEYLYRRDHKEDLSYLLNLDIFYHYTINNVLGTIRGETQPAARTGETLSGDFSREGALRSYSRPQQITEKKEFDYFKNVFELNLKYNIVPLIEENPNTQFVFFMVPFSMLFWDREMRSGTFDATVYALECAIDHLLDYDNVKIYFYRDRWDVAEDLDNYKDYIHYGAWINSEVSLWIAADEGRVTRHNYQEILDGLRAFVYAYDFESIFKQ